MWERWNSIMPDGSFGDVGMNSFNHYAYGAVGDWMYQNIGGIKALEAGYRKIQVAPAVGGGLTHGAGHYDSAYGAIATDWKTTGDDLALEVEVPVNTTAEVVLPAANAYAVTEGGQLLTDVDGVTDVTAADGERSPSRSGPAATSSRSPTANGRLGAILEAARRRCGARGRPRRRRATCPPADAEQLDRGLARVRDDVEAALLATLAGDEDAAVAALQTRAGRGAARCAPGSRRPGRRRRSATTWTAARRRSRPRWSAPDRGAGRLGGAPAGRRLRPCRAAP